MKANVLDQFGDPENFSWRELPMPAPGPTDVLVRVQAAAVNFGDTMIRAGAAGLPWGPELVLGSEVAGVVEALGGQVVGIEIGQRVYAAPFLAGRMGGYATHLALPASAVFPLPDHMADADVVALGVAGLTALELAGLAPVKDRVAVVHAAAGGVGHLLVQLLKAAGGTVVGLVGDPAKAEAVAGLGADHVLPTRGDWPAALLAATGGRAPDLVFDAAGGALTTQGLAMLAPGGHYIAYGGASGTYPAISPTEMPRFVMNGQTLIGFSMMPILSTDRARGWVAAGLATLFDHLKTGRLKPLIGRRLPLEAAAEAHRLLESRASTGKIVLVP